MIIDLSVARKCDTKQAIAKTLIYWGTAPALGVVTKGRHTQQGCIPMAVSVSENGHSCEQNLQGCDTLHIRAYIRPLGTTF